MAKKKATQAEKKVSNTRKTNPPATKSKKTKKPAPPPKKAPKITNEYDPPAPNTFLASVTTLLLFILFVMISIRPEGALLRVVQSVVLGLIGRAGFYFSIPALLYSFCFHTFGKKKGLRMRSICLSLFVLFCGAIYHLFMQKTELYLAWSIFSKLYSDGGAGFGGGVLCGGLAMLLNWSCGKTLSYLMLIPGALVCLLSAMNMTPAAFYRALRDRPRAEWEGEEEEEDIEPAAIVVNKITTKQIEKERKRREQAAQFPPPPASANKKSLPFQSPDQPRQQLPKKTAKSAPQPTRTAEQPQTEPMKQPIGRGAAFMSRVDQDISSPLGGIPIRPDPEEAELLDEQMVALIKSAEEPVESGGMPELKRSEPAEASKPVAPKPEKAAPAKPKASPRETEEEARSVAAEIARGQEDPTREYRFPPIELLSQPGGGSVDGTDEMRENSRRLSQTLANFKIGAEMGDVIRGPSVTRYEVKLNDGVRLNKLTGAADDIALCLGVSGVRIAAITGKNSVVGIEVPNKNVTTVSLREVISDKDFKDAKSRTSFSVGKDIGGKCIVGNIAKMPHLLIAGTTGSGKSVCMNSIIISLLYKARPEEVKLIMVDPKMVELGIYNGIPHLLIPVVTDAKKAAGSLQWAVTEMLRRYKMMSEAGVRDLESYNTELTEQGEPEHRLPQVVVIIDELADMMMVAAKEVEDSICRIAQMGRAAGIHLIIATQRPSADVITGLMKANIPSRIAFSVASAMESRIILDTQGAEKLVGRGDMLYAPIGSGKPVRVQGCFVTDKEVEAVTDFVKKHSTAVYDEGMLEEIERNAAQAGGSKKGAAPEPRANDEELEGDDMLPQAVDVILESGIASVSLLQRRLKLGYARAARIVDEMEEKGIVGPFQGSKPRAILISKEEWAQRRSGGAQMTMDDYVPDEE